MKAIHTLFMLVFFWSAIVHGALAVTVVGVSPGDSFAYRLECFWSSTNSSVACPASAAEFNNTDWILDITDVYDATVEYDTTVGFENGTEQSNSYTVNLETGSSSGGSPAPVVLLCQAGLNAGDSIFPGSSYLVFVNETIMRQYPYGQRETNRITINSTDVPEDYAFYYIDVLLDRALGVSVDIYLEQCQVYNQSGTTYESRISYHSVLVSSNAFVVPEFSSFLALPTILVATLLAVVAHTISRIRNKRRAC